MATKSPSQHIDADAVHCALSISSFQQRHKRKATSETIEEASPLSKREKGLPNIIAAASVLNEEFESTAWAQEMTDVDPMKLIQAELLAQQLKRRPLAEPPIFRYTLFEGFDTLQKEAKNSPSTSRTELAWITGYVDLQSEIDLLHQYENSIWGTARENVSEGIDSKNDFLIGLAREVWEDAKTVQEERMELQKRHGKSWEEVLELHYLVRYGRDEEGNVKWLGTEEIGLEEWEKGYDGWGFREGRDLMKVRLGIKGMVLP